MDLTFYTSQSTTLIRSYFRIKTHHSDVIMGSVKQRRPSVPVWEPQREGATEVRKGKAGVFTPAGRDCIPAALFIIGKKRESESERQGKTKKREEEEEWLVKRNAASCVNTYKERWQGPLYWTVNKQKVGWIMCLFWKKSPAINRPWEDFKEKEYKKKGTRQIHYAERIRQICNICF